VGKMRCKVCNVNFETIPIGSNIEIDVNGKILSLVACAECWDKIMNEKPEITITPFKYTQAPSCLNCHWNGICGCGEFGDKGICLLYKEMEE